MWSHKCRLDAFGIDAADKIPFEATRAQITLRTYQGFYLRQLTRQTDIAHIRHLCSRSYCRRWQPSGRHNSHSLVICIKEKLRLQTSDHITKQLHFHSHSWLQQIFVGLFYLLAPTNSFPGWSQNKIKVCRVSVQNTYFRKMTAFHHYHQDTGKLRCRDTPWVHTNRSSHT